MSYDDLSLKVTKIYNSVELPNFQKLKRLLASSKRQVYFEIYYERGDNSVNFLFQDENGKPLIINGQGFTIKGIRTP